MYYKIITQLPPEDITEAALRLLAEHRYTRRNFLYSSELVTDTTVWNINTRRQYALEIILSDYIVDVTVIEDAVIQRVWGW